MPSGGGLQSIVDKGESHARMGRYDEALSSFGTAIRMLPQSPELRHNIGSTLQQMGREAEAIDSWHAALAVNPHFSASRRALEDSEASASAAAARHWHSSEAASAASAWRIAILASPLKAGYHSSRGDALTALGHASEGEHCFQRKAYENTQKNEKKWLHDG